MPDSVTRLGASALSAWQRSRTPEARAITLKNVTLDYKYDLTQSRVFVTGYQALIRACLMQQERDRRAGLNTAGYVSGYRGSPLGGLDQQFMRAKAHLERQNVLFHSGLNEDLAATSICRMLTFMMDARWASALSPA